MGATFHSWRRDRRRDNDRRTNVAAAAGCAAVNASARVRYRHLRRSGKGLTLRPTASFAGRVTIVSGAELADAGRAVLSLGPRCVDRKIQLAEARAGATAMQAY
jgi:hypothetical protein